MLFKISWRNIWRNKTRSFILMTAVGFGVWAAIFLISMMFGLSDQRFQSLINNEISHIQVHHNEFAQNFEPGLTITKGEEVFQQIKQMPQVEAVTKRILATGMIASTTTSSGVKVIGIYPDMERHVTDISESIIEGSFFQEDRKFPIVIGQELAKKLNVKLGTKIVVQFQSADGQITAGAYKVSGIFRTESSVFDEGNVFVRANELAGAMALNNESGETGSRFHEIALLLKNPEELEQVKSKIEGIGNADVLVQSWKDLAPDLNYMNEIMDFYWAIITGIIMLALAFGILNTMLMAIMERVREIGMLMAVGMNKLRIFLMIVLETVMLAFTGGLVGLLLGYVTVNYFSRHGIDLTIFKEGLSAFGMGTHLFLQLDSKYYPMMSGMVLITAVLSSIYPAIRALKLKPAEAIRAI